MSEEKEAVTYTTAGAEYDWFGTRELDASAGTNKRGQTVRKVAGPEGYLEGQRGRYMSGNHMAVDEAEWQKLVAYGLAEVGAPAP